MLTNDERSTRTRSTLDNNDANSNQVQRKAKNMRQTYKRLIKYTLQYPALMIMANVGMLVSSGGMIILPMLCGSIIDHIKNS